MVIFIEPHTTKQITDIKVFSAVKNKNCEADLLSSDIASDIRILPHLRE